jgi:hypothetical protein
LLSLLLGQKIGIAHTGLFECDRPYLGRFFHPWPLFKQIATCIGAIAIIPVLKIAYLLQGQRYNMSQAQLFPGEAYHAPPECIRNSSSPTELDYRMAIAPACPAWFGLLCGEGQTAARERLAAISTAAAIASA